MGNNPYLQFILANTPRVLSQIDRDPDSPTYGCCDRNFWHYKIRDFPSAILQQAGLGLALLYSFNFRGNIYYKKEEIKEISVSTLNFWMKIQHKDGSFDEYWPNEHGIPPTVFTLYSMSEVCKIFSLKDQAVFSSIRKAAQYLAKNIETQALNQEIASICAIYNASKVLRSETLKTISKNKLDVLLNKQDDEGWFAEYGGADIGYLTVSLDFMCEYYRLSKDEKSKESITKIVNFLQYFVHPDGSLGGEYGSRNTEYFMPAGFETASKFVAVAGSIVGKLMEYSNQNNYLDDRYLCHYVFHSYVRAAMRYRSRKKTKLPAERNCSIVFENSGFYIVSNNKFYVISALAKGGVTIVFDKKTKKKLLNDCGYRVKMKGKMYVTNWQNQDYSYSVADEGYNLETNFYSVKFHTPTSLQHFVLRCTSFFLGRRIIPLMKKLFIFGSEKTSLSLKRTIKLQKNKVLITDNVSSSKNMDYLTSTEGLSLRYCPSSRYYQTNNLNRQVYKYEKRNVKNAVIKKTVE